MNSPDGSKRSGVEQFDLTGRVALVTGSSQGIGRTLAGQLASAGALVVLNARSADRLDAAQQKLEADGASVDGVVADVTEPDAVTGLVDTIVERHGRIDIVVNNAGMQFREALVDFPVEEARRILDLNLLAPFLVAQAAARHMIPQGNGKIINIGSVQSQLGRANIVPYAASKGGIVTLTRGLCAELAGHNIQVNAIAPGYFATELTADLVADPEFSAWVANRTPAGRWGDVDELGGAVIFLASDASSFVNGQVLYVDGGMTAVV